MSENVFVENYHKELSLTGYPFDRFAPIVLSSGNVIPMGCIIDASIYVSKTDSAPRLTAVSKNMSSITFYAGDFYGTLNFKENEDIVELYDDRGIFGGILLIDIERKKLLLSLLNGRFTVTSDTRFCLRCIEVLPPVGVTRFTADDGNVVSGNVIIAAGTGGLFRLLSVNDVPYVETNYIGSPVYSYLSEEGYMPKIPLRYITYAVEGSGVSGKIYPDEYGNIAMVPNNPQSDILQDPLRINTADASIKLSLAGAGK